MPKCDFNLFQVTLQLYGNRRCSPVNLRHAFRTPFSKKIWTAASVLLK